MATHTWPVSVIDGYAFPQRFAPQSFNRRLKPTVVRSQPQVGPVRTRGLSTQRIYVVRGIVIVYEEHVATLDDFFFVTLRRGTARFNWVDPVKNSVMVEMAFLSEPEYSAAGPLFYAASLQLEMYPL